MLKIFNDLRHFFNDSYERIGVREYSRLMKISAPTASKLLELYHKEGLLCKEPEKMFIYYYANKESKMYVELTTLYWKEIIHGCGLIDFLKESLISPIVIMFGSLTKGEIRKESDIDLAVFSATNKKIDVSLFEKKLKRNIQLFRFKDLDGVKSIELKNNILNGYRIIGGW